MKRTTFFKSLLLAAGLSVGANAWADLTPFSESYNAESATTGWTTSVNGRFTPTILNESDNYYLSVAQNSRDNNGAVVTGNILSKKAAAGDDFTLLFDMRLGNSNDQNPVVLSINDAANSGVILSLTATAKNVTTWTVNGTSTQITLPNSGPNSATDGTAITGITWCSYKITRSGDYTYVTITNKSTGVDILERTLIGGASTTGGLGNIVFTTKRKYANFAIDNIVLRAIQDGDVPAAEPTTCTVHFLNESGTSIKDDVTINTLVGANVNANDYVAAIYTTDKKYIYKSGNDPITAVADATSNVITLVFREAGTWAYTINAVDGDNAQIQEVASGTQFEGDSKKVYFPKAFEKSGVWYETSSNASGASYYGFTLNESTNTKDVVYSTTTDIDYFFECEDMDVVERRDGGSSEDRGSNGAGVRLSNGGYIYTTALAAGTYTLRMNCNNPNSGTPTFNIKIWDGEKLLETGKTIQKTVASTANFAEEMTENIVVPEGMCLAICNNTGYNANPTLDYIILKKTADATYPVEITSAGWATLYTPYALNFAGTGLTAYTATLADSKVKLAAVENVPAGTGVVLKGDAKTYDIPVIASSETAKGSLEGNAIAATAFDAFEGYTLYILTKSGDEAQFNPMGSGSLAAGKAYLKVAKTAGEARSFKVVFADETTGINSVKAEASAEGIYSLSGQRVANPVKGLYIVNGKKVIIK